MKPAFMPVLAIIDEGHAAPNELFLSCNRDKTRRNIGKRTTIDGLTCERFKSVFVTSRLIDPPDPAEPDIYISIYTPLPTPDAPIHPGKMVTVSVQPKRMITDPAPDPMGLSARPLQISFTLVDAKHTQTEISDDYYEFSAATRKLFEKRLKLGSYWAEACNHAAPK